jgi:hypothetical protein
MSQHKMIGLAFVLASCVTMAARAAFVAPTVQQVASAAAAPATGVAPLLAQADAAQAADVVTRVIAVVVGLDLTADQRRDRVTAVLRAAMDVVPAAMRGTFALELGKAIAATPAILNAPTVLAAIRSFLLAQSAGGGADGSEQAKQFNTGLSATSQDAMLPGSASASHPHPPPIAGPYAGQQTR